MQYNCMYQLNLLKCASQHTSGFMYVDFLLYICAHTCAHHMLGLCATCAYVRTPVRITCLLCARHVRMCAHMCVCAHTCASVRTPVRITCLVFARHVCIQSVTVFSLKL
eukprot:GHVS01030021.1.p2 GENE.GHVS01030021.1~~GHVS01030021.1.p2  ORF type:complete len:109 (+),score=1.63 GHVS01030021.1:201-527(+)